VPRRIIIDKRSGDLLDDTIVGKRDPLLDDGVESWTAVLDRVATDTVQGHVVPIAGRLTVTARSAKGHEDAFTMTYRFDQLNLSPAFDANAFRPTLRDGTLVTNLDDPSGLAYEWRNGAVVKKIDARVEQQVSSLSAMGTGDTQDRQGNSWLDRKLVVAAAAFLVTGGCALAAWSRSKSRRELPRHA
jgi:hypothetical protein